MEAITKRPWRNVVAEEKRGSDTVTLDCGHKRVLAHSWRPRKRAQCLRCEGGQ